MSKSDKRSAKDYGIDRIPEILSRLDDLEDAVGRMNRAARCRVVDRAAKREHAKVEKGHAH